MPFIKHFLHLARIVCSLLLAIFATNSFPADKPDWHYIVGSSVNLRNAPGTDADIVIKLSIGSPVQIVGFRGEWVQLHDGNQGWIGWTLQDLISKRQPTFAEMWNNYRKANLDDTNERKKWLERALAFEPINLEILDALAAVYAQSGDEKRAHQTRKEIDFIRNPESFQDPNERQIIFVASGQYFEPLAFLDGNSLSSTFTNQADLDRLIGKYFRAGRKYNLFNHEGHLGTATVTRSVIPGSINPDNCTGAISAETRIDTGENSSAQRFLLATNRPIRQPGKTRQRPLTAQELSEISKLSGSLLLKQLLFRHLNLEPLDWRQKEYYKKMGKKAPTTTTGFAIDLQGNGAETLVAVMRYTSPPEELEANGGEMSEFGAYVLLVLEKTKESGKAKVIYQAVGGGNGDAIIRTFQILGFADANQDGILDILTQEDGYEHTAIRVLESAKDKGRIRYQLSSAFSASGC